MPDGARLSRNGSELDAVDKGLLKRNVFDARVVEAVDIVPVWSQSRRAPSRAILTVDLLLLVVLVLDGGEEDGGLVREKDTVGFLQSVMAHRKKT